MTQCHHPPLDLHWWQLNTPSSNAYQVCISDHTLLKLQFAALLFIRWEPYLPYFFSDDSPVDITCQLSPMQILVDVSIGGQHTFLLASETHWWHQVITLQLFSINLPSASRFHHVYSCRLTSILLHQTGSPTNWFVKMTYTPSQLLILSSLSW